MPRAGRVELAVAFAEAIARPGASAGLLDSDNQLSGWVTIETAVESGQAYLVEPRDGILAIDLDSPDDHAWAAAVRTAVEPRGCLLVETTSGRPGHGHLWVISPPGWGHDFTKLQMEEIAGPNRLQVRTAGTRPPLAPHRSEPTRSTVVSPGEATALRWFRDAAPRDLSETARHQLRWLHSPHAKRHKGDPSRDRTLYSVAIHMVNARRTFEDYLTELRDPANETASKYREMDLVKRDDWARRKWQDAVDWVRVNPPKAAHRETLEGLREDVGNMAWSPRTGSSDRKVYEALLCIGIEAASLVVNASVRQLAQETTLSTSGIQTVINHLLEQGFIARADEPDRAHHLARSFRLLTSVPRESAVRTHTSPYLRGPMTRCAEEVQILEDIFTNGSGLGLSTRETWEALPELPTKTAEVVALRPGQCRHNTVRAQLRKLERHSLAARSGHRWWRLEPSLEELIRLAQGLGVRDKNHRRNAQYERERQEYLSRFHTVLSTESAA